MYKNIPKDWENPDWSKMYRVHEWKNYVSGNLKKIWQDFTPEQRKILSECFNNIADSEDWE